MGRYGIASIVGATLFLSPHARAANSTVFTDRTAFNAAVSPTNQQDFQSYAIGTNMAGVNFLPGVNVTSPNLQTITIFGPPGDHVLFGLDRTQPGDLFYDINVTSPYRAFGFNIEDFDPATPGPAPVDVFFADATTRRVNIFPGATELTPVFFGIAADTDITHIRVTWGPEIVPNANEEITLDDFALSRVPEPGSAFLLSLGALDVFTRRRFIADARSAD